MPGLSDTRAAAVLNRLFNGATLTVPSSYYIALSTTEPADDGTGVTEPTATSYARLAVAVNTTNFPTTATRIITNGVALTFATPGAAEDWGVIGWYALYDASTGGTFHGWGLFANAQQVTTATGPVTIAVGDLILTAPGS